MDHLYTRQAIERVVIAGGGFAGVNLAQELLKNDHYHVTLIDRNNYNYFPPLLYQVSTGFLDASTISYPFRKLLRNKRFKFRMAEVLEVDPKSHVLYLNNGVVYYDYMIFATGARTNFFGNANIERNAIPMKTINDALRMRNSLFKSLEAAAIATTDEERKRILNVVIAGGGPTGVEVSGMLAEIKKTILPREYPELRGISGEIYIVDGGSHLLGPMSDKSHDDAFKVISDLGVNIILNTHVLDFKDNLVHLSNGSVIEAQTLIWAAGITAHTIKGIPESCLGIGKRMITDEYNQLIGLEDIYAIGDSSIQTTDKHYPKGHPQLAQVAIQQGKNLAFNLMATAEERRLRPFSYYDKGEMAVIGRRHAVVDLFKHKLHVRGFSALLMWLIVHLVSLVNTSNKIRTLFSWIVAYLSTDLSLRMIYRPEPEPEPDNRTHIYRTDENGKISEVFPDSPDKEEPNKKQRQI